MPSDCLEVRFKQLAVMNELFAWAAAVSTILMAVINGTLLVFVDVATAWRVTDFILAIPAGSTVRRCIEGIRVVEEKRRTAVDGWRNRTRAWKIRARSNRIIEGRRGH